MSVEIKERKKFNLNMIGLKIPTGGKQTSWLFMSMTEDLKQGLPRHNSSLVARVELEASISGFKSGSATLHPNRTRDSCDLPVPALVKIL